MSYEASFSIADKTGKEISLKDAFALGNKVGTPSFYDPNGKYDATSWEYCESLLSFLQEQNLVSYEITKESDSTFESDESVIY